MLAELTELCTELENIKDNLVKLNVQRRTQKTLSEKLKAADELYEQYINFAKTISNNILEGNVSQETIDAVKEKSDKIVSIYNKIKDFCKNSCIEQVNMAKFDLKTAISLLPVMTGEEDITKKLIDGIDFYKSMIDKESIPALISFVLKTRLSESAKLRMSQSYANCESLISDLKTNFLPKKSSTAVHCSLMNTKQHSLSIDEYGNQIEKLLVDLTISQTDGNQEAYKILRPINEKLAIKRFADGLRNPTLGIIISARNPSTLKEAIQAAKDEEISTVRDGEPSIFFGNPGTTGRYIPRYSNRGYGRWHRGAYPTRSRVPLDANQQASGNYSQGQPSRVWNNHRYQNQRRGRGAVTPSRGGVTGSQQVYVAEEQPQPTTSSSTVSQNEISNRANPGDEFFRP